MSCKDHTPGPWHWEDNGMWGNTLFNDKKKSVAYIYNPGSFSFYINISPPDECLIAAAPDLLEELKYLVKTIKEDELCGSGLQN